MELKPKQQTLTSPVVASEDMLVSKMILFLHTVMCALFPQGVVLIVAIVV